MSEQEELAPYERLDDLQYRGRYLIQDTREFMFSLDAVLLAHFPKLRGQERVLDLGTGTGVIPHLLADYAQRIDAVELNPVLARLAARNVRLNGLTDKIFVQQGDYRNIAAIYPKGVFDLALANPPYWPVKHGALPQGMGRAQARHELTATLMDTVCAARYALRPGGRLAMIHLPERLGEIFAALQAHGFAAKRLRLVEPQLGKTPKHALVEAVVGGQSGGLKVLPTLCVRGADGAYTEELLAIYGLKNAGA